MLSSVIMMLLLLLSGWSVPSPSGRSSRNLSFAFVDAVAVALPGNTTGVVDVEGNIARDPNMTLGKILREAGRKGLGGGVPGAVAGIIQVLTLMGLRTVINYQMRYGTPFLKALDILYKVSFWKLVPGEISN